MAGGVEKIWWTDLLSPFKEDILSGLPVTRALIAALPIWMSMDGSTWLVVDERESVRDSISLGRRWGYPFQRRGWPVR